MDEPLLLSVLRAYMTHADPKLSAKGKSSITAKPGGMQKRLVILLDSCYMSETCCDICSLPHAWLFSPDQFLPACSFTN